MEILLRSWAPGVPTAYIILAILGTLSFLIVISLFIWGYIKDRNTKRLHFPMVLSVLMAGAPAIISVKYSQETEKEQTQTENTVASSDAAPAEKLAALHKLAKRPNLSLASEKFIADSYDKLHKQDLADKQYKKIKKLDKKFTIPTNRISPAISSEPQLTNGRVGG